MFKRLDDKQRRDFLDEVIETATVSVYNYAEDEREKYKVDIERIALVDFLLNELSNENTNKKELKDILCCLINEEIIDETFVYRYYKEEIVVLYLDRYAENRSLIRAYKKGRLNILWQAKIYYFKLN